MHKSAPQKPPPPFLCGLGRFPKGKPFRPLGRSGTGRAEEGVEEGGAGLDNVQLLPVAEPGTLGRAALGSLGVLRSARRRRRQGV